MYLADCCDCITQPGEVNKDPKTTRGQASHRYQPPKISHLAKRYNAEPGVGARRVWFWALNTNLICRYWICRVLTGPGLMRIKNSGSQTFYPLPSINNITLHPLGHGQCWYFSCPTVWLYWAGFHIHPTTNSRRYPISQIFPKYNASANSLTSSCALKNKDYLSLRLNKHCHSPNNYIPLTSLFDVEIRHEIIIYYWWCHSIAYLVAHSHKTLDGNLSCSTRAVVYCVLLRS